MPICRNIFMPPEVLSWKIRKAVFSHHHRANQAEIMHLRTLCLPLNIGIPPTTMSRQINTEIVCAWPPLKSKGELKILMSLAHYT
jgi:hypothetical protein